MQFTKEQKPIARNVLSTSVPRLLTPQPQSKTTKSRWEELQTRQHSRSMVKLSSTRHLTTQSRRIRSYLKVKTLFCRRTAHDDTTRTPTPISTTKKTSSFSTRTEVRPVQASKIKTRSLRENRSLRKDAIQRTSAYSTKCSCRTGARSSSWTKAMSTLSIKIVMATWSTVTTMV